MSNGKIGTSNGNGIGMCNGFCGSGWVRRPARTMDLKISRFEAIKNNRTLYSIVVKVLIHA